MRREMRRKKPAKSKVESEVIPLEDLAPRGDVTGGAGRLLFGERVGPATQGVPATHGVPEERRGDDVRPPRGGKR